MIDEVFCVCGQQITSEHRFLGSNRAYQCPKCSMIHRNPKFLRDADGNPIADAPKQKTVDSMQQPTPSAKTRLTEDRRKVEEILKNREVGK